MSEPLDAAAAVRLVALGPEHAATLRAIRREPEVERWWDPLEPDFPWEDDPDTTRFAVMVDGEVVGMIQYAEELEPKYRAASIDIFLATAHHGRGIGTAAVRRMVEHLITERGHHRVSIDPTVRNAAAMRCYAKAGFRPVGIQRRAERDAEGVAWHDALLMEVVVDPPGAPIADEDPARAAELERSLLAPAVRSSRAALEVLLHPAFVEHGGSGRRFDRAEAIDARVDEAGLDAPEVSGLAVEPVAPGAVLVTYRLRLAGGATSRRSSLWLWTSGGWRLRFHQGTPAHAQPST